MDRQLAQVSGIDKVKLSTTKPAPKGINGERSTTTVGAKKEGSKLALGRSQSVHGGPRGPMQSDSLGLRNEIVKCVEPAGGDSNNTSVSRSQSTSQRPSKMPPPSSFPGMRSHTRIKSTGGSPLPVTSSPSKAVQSTSTTTSRSSSIARNASTKARDSIGSTSTTQSPRPSLTGSRSERSLSVATTASNNTTIVRPAFSTYQRDFSPSASTRAGAITGRTRTSSSTKASAVTRPLPLRHASTSTPQKPRVLPTSTRPATQHTTVPTPPTTADLLLQTKLLHFSILHQTAPLTLSTYTRSAHTSLKTRFTVLQDLYRSLLLLKREARQSANLLALSQWCGGNVPALCRKLDVLTRSVGELMDLTRPAKSAGGAVDEKAAVTGEQQSEEGNEHNNEGGEEDTEEEGRYSLITSAFESWINWVGEVWTSRDLDVEGDLQPAAPALGRDAALTPLDRLGDGMKSELRSLSSTINAIVTRLEGLGSIPLPKVIKGQTTPVRLLELALILGRGMQEELQTMREIEYEVMIGEKAWVKERVRLLAG